jgi:methylenetetrahydromethanopterin dehydrogenase
MKRPIRIGIVKAGCIGTLPLLEFLLDERADRTDIDVTVVGSGSKLGLEQCRKIAKLMINQQPDFVILIGPAQASPGPTEARRMISEAGMPAVVISDGPTEEIAGKIEKMGLGYIIVGGDPMIGARREFLDPTEMALYNSDAVKVLAATGTLSLIGQELDKIVNSIKDGESPILPRIIIRGPEAMDAAGFVNPYARAKAAAAYDIAREVAKINLEACFQIRDWKVYVSRVAEGHEMMRIAARMADEAREIEKKGDTVLREPHFKDGSRGRKRALIEKPKRN